MKLISSFIHDAYPITVPSASLTFSNSYIRKDHSCVIRTSTLSLVNLDELL